MSLLKDLFMASNDISGQLPTEMSFLTSLEVLDLQGNKISGNLPTAIESLVNLRVLMLGSQGGAKKLSGPLLDFKSNLKLVDLDLTGNSLQGTIPSTFLQGVGQTADVHIFLSGNEIQGEIPTSLDKLAKLNIDLSGNKINGLSGVLCDSNNTDWMEGKVGEIGCNAILCPPGTALPGGRQVETATPCKACANGIIEARYFGSKECVPEQVNIERSVLMTLYILLNGTEWLDQTNWNSDKSVCTWFGITCNSSAVTEISLEDNNLDSGEGDVSALLFSLPHLKSVDLKGNKVALNLVKIPASTQLEMLQLSATGLKSLVGVSTATGLRQLHVTDNDLKGNMPDEIFALTNLHSLYLSFNEFTGPLPSSIGNLSKLEEFYMYGNNITGPLPGQAISKLTSIVDFIMAENFLSGDLPIEFSSLPNLEQLSLFGQQGKARINGTIPNFSGAPKLWYFDVTSNEMTGTIPPDFMKNSIYVNDEVTVYLGQNSLTGSVPSSLEAFTNIDLLIVGNKITSIPAELCDNPGKRIAFAGYLTLECGLTIFTSSLRRLDGGSVENNRHLRCHCLPSRNMELNWEAGG
jgi:Leucine-rich repeat (LRR) protein